MAIQDQHGFRKLNNGLIINTDETYYKQLKLQRSQRKATTEVIDKVEKLEQDIADTKSDINEIKNILMQLVHRNG
jgi:hypothetical protein